MFAYYLKLSVLSLRKTPILSMLIIVAIAMGIGLSMTTLTVYHMLGADPIPEKSDTLFTVQLDSYGRETNYPSSDGLHKQITYIDAINLHKNTVAERQTRLFRSGGAMRDEQGKVPAFMDAMRYCDSDFFEMFGLEFIHGSTWDKRVDIEPESTVVITDTLSEKVFGDSNSVGKTLQINQKPYVVIGVIKEFSPSPFFYDLSSGNFKDAERIFLPFSLIPVDEPVIWGNITTWKRGQNTGFSDMLTSESLWILYWVELIDQKQQQEYSDFLANYISEQKSYGRFEKDNPQSAFRNVNDWIEYNQVITQDDRILVGLGFLFLLACLVNSVGLLLAKFQRTVAQSGVRRALGASRRDLHFQYLVEVTLIGFVGGLLGLLITWLGLEGIKSIFFNYDTIAKLDMYMVAVTLSVSIISALAAGIFPVLKICRTQPSIYLKSQ